MYSLLIFALGRRLPENDPETLGDPTLTARIGPLTVPDAQELGIPRTTQWYQQKRLKSGAPMRVYRKVGARLAAPVAETVGTEAANPTVLRANRL
jgi:hypothetical protein